MSQSDGGRIRQVNRAEPAPKGEYVLYWMQIYRRLERNHALDHALDWARRLRKPLVGYEGLRLDYPWASQRLHRFVLEGMADNAATARKVGLNYWPFVETPQQSGRGLLRRLAARACLVVTDDFPCFIIPEQTAALAARTDTAVIAVDSNSIVPLAALGDAVVSAAQLRRRIHRAFADAWPKRASKKHHIPDAIRMRIAAPFATWRPARLDRFLECLPLDAGVPPVTDVPGGAMAAKTRLRQFIRRRLRGYAEQRSVPAAPQSSHGSGLSPYLHFGHISIEEVVEQVLEEAAADWSPRLLRDSAAGRREGFFGANADVNSFLDEAITWRDVGLNWHWSRRGDTASLERALPKWALATLRKHRRDRRAYRYSLEEWEDGATHDPLWNAAQRELVATGTIHNYLRMLWGKKVIEWSKTPEEAYQTLVHLNNKYALDGRDPNSYTGILWCFGLFDRPWAPERPVLGSVRYMSSANTGRKFALGSYYAYIETLPPIGEVRGGRAQKARANDPK
jgi:deoxyribodipyrimidine photo-lyase